MTAVTRMVRTATQNSIVSHLLELRAALEEQRVFRAEQLSELIASAAAGSDISTDASRDEVADALRAGATAALCDIEAALARMDAGRFGSCESCGGEIPLERLEILPMAALCMRCARTHQHGAK